MISLSPINKNIRETLATKSKAVARDFTGGALDTRSEEVDLLKDTYAKSTWVRAFSPVDSTSKPIQDSDGEWFLESGLNPDGYKTVTLLGGNTEFLGGERTMLHGFKHIYNPLRSREEVDGDRSPKLRPMPGLKDINVEYKGGLSAVREATINWTCWTFEDLEKLMPHFLAHGKGILLEWGWGMSSVEQELMSGLDDMTNGKAYSNIQNKINELGGNYDGMAGIISNWEWTLRDDGGFDCTTTIVSRGVNVIDQDISGTGTSKTNEDGEQEPTIKEFVGALRETITSFCTEEDSWWDLGDPFPVSDDAARIRNWSPSTGVQPPGVVMVVEDGVWTNVKAGPYVTWGWFEDNILSKFIGRVDEKGNTINSFRSIEPVLHPDGSGRFLKNDGKSSTDNIHEARFQSVIIKNNKWLITPDMGRWILPGQFPALNTIKNSWGSASINALKRLVNITEDYKQVKRFAVDQNDWSKGGYLRNILLSYDLIETAFENANTVREGMSALFGELGKDLDGFWNLEVVVDAYIDGNVKCIDTKAVAFDAETLLEDREGKENPESKLFVFPSWGEKSIVKNQTLTSAVPNSMAVSAMYAGTAKKGKEKEGAPPEAQAIAELQGGDSLDASQRNIQMADRIGGKTAFGSKNPYGTLANDIGWSDQNFESDEYDDRNTPNRDEFGQGHGIPFNKIGIDEIISFYEKKEKSAGNDTSAREKELQEKKKQDLAKSEEALRIFKTLHPNAPGGNQPSVEVSQPANWAQKFFSFGFNTEDEEDVSMYTETGNLQELPAFSMLFRRTMLDYINGRVNDDEVSEEEKLELVGQPIIPVDLEITVDGIGGIIPGNAFHVDYIPQKYKDYVCFQIFGVTQSVGSDYWNTTIIGKPRVAMKKLIMDSRK
jgi:hypothetical protein